MSETLEQIAETLSKLTVLEMSKLKKMLEDKWGVVAPSGITTVMAGPVAGAATPVAVAEEFTEFRVILTSIDPAKKIPVIKEIRTVTDLSLQEARDLVTDTPKDIKTVANKKDAEEIKKKLEDVGAVVEIKGV